MGAGGLINSILRLKRVLKARKELKSKPYCSNCNLCVEPGISICPSCKKEIATTMGDINKGKMRDITKYNLIGLLCIFLGLITMFIVNIYFGFFMMIIGGIILYIAKQKFLIKPMRELEVIVNANLACPYCGKKVSSNYNACPHCAKDLRGKITPVTVSNPLLDALNK